MLTYYVKPLLTPQVPAIMEAIFEPTLNMINQDFAEYPEHRSGFFRLLRVINLNCFPGEQTDRHPIKWLLIRFIS